VRSGGAAKIAAARKRSGARAKGAPTSGARVRTGAQELRLRPAAAETKRTDSGARASKNYGEGYRRQTCDLRPGDLERARSDGARPDDDAAGTGRRGLPRSAEEARQADRSTLRAKAKRARASGQSEQENAGTGPGEIASLAAYYGQALAGEGHQRSARWSRISSDQRPLMKAKTAPRTRPMKRPRSGFRPSQPGLGSASAAKGRSNPAEFG